jgi:hypothetical protein|tara:strand:+ start:6839 stop:7054 length:216 start_codon:yes stop_codon:yes gene_type:complete
MEDVIRKPKHYAQYKIEPIEFIMANDLNFCEGNVIKYVLRYRDKGGIESLNKAKQYIDFMIRDMLEKGEVT